MRRSIVPMRPRSRRRSSGLLPAAGGLLLAVSWGASADPGAAEGQNVQLEVRGQTVRAFIVQKDPSPEVPGVVIVHGWWGLTEQMRGGTERVADLGYVAILPDLYRGRLPADLGYAHDFMRDLDEDWVMQVLKAAIQHLRSMPGALRRPVGLVGFDMGGRLALTAALRGLPVQAAVSFYGDTRSDRDEVDALDVPFLGIYAHDDRATPPDEVKRFEALLKELGKNARIEIMADVGRYFANEDRPGFDAEATRSAWYHTREFLAASLNGAAYVPQRKGEVFRDERFEKDHAWKKRQPPP